MMFNGSPHLSSNLVLKCPFEYVGKKEAGVSV